jgi:hypothetical protein
VRVHRLKTWPGPFRAVWRGDKGHEFRRDDRDFRVGDWLLLLEWKPKRKTFTGRRISARVTYVTRGRFGVPRGFAVLPLSRATGSTGGAMLGKAVPRDFPVALRVRVQIYSVLRASLRFAQVREVQTGFGV